MFRLLEHEYRMRDVEVLGAYLVLATYYLSAANTR